MAIEAAEIIRRICRYAASHSVLLGAVRVQKLVYLMECEFYRWEHARLTVLDWKFFHYGPWSGGLADVLQDEFHIEQEVLSNGRLFNRIQHIQSDFYRMPERFSDVTVQGIFERTVETWASAPLPDLLDFVYFHTPPMQGIVRGDLIDFSKASEVKPERDLIDPYRSISGEREKKLKEAAARWAKRKREPETVKHLVADELLVEAIRAMDVAESPELHLTGKPLAISDEVARDVRGESGGNFAE